MPASWTCTACSRHFDARPLRCDCGSRRFVELVLRADDAGAVTITAVERKPKPRV